MRCSIITSGAWTDHSKVSGIAEYTYDKQAPGMLYGRLLRSPHAHARVLKVDCDSGATHVRREGVISITDKPASEISSAGTKPSEPRDTIVNFAGEPVAAVAAKHLKLRGTQFELSKLTMKYYRTSCVPTTR